MKFSRGNEWIRTSICRKCVAHHCSVLGKPWRIPRGDGWVELAKSEGNVGKASCNNRTTPRLEYQYTEITYFQLLLLKQPTSVSVGALRAGTGSAQTSTPSPSLSKGRPQGDISPGNQLL